MSKVYVLIKKLSLTEFDILGAFDALHVKEAKERVYNDIEIQRRLKLEDLNRSLNQCQADAVRFSGMINEHYLETLNKNITDLKNKSLEEIFKEKGYFFLETDLNKFIEVKD